MKNTFAIQVAAAGHCAAQEPASLQPRLPAIFVTGDSTASNVDGRGWGDPF